MTMPTRLLDTSPDPSEPPDSMEGPISGASDVRRLRHSQPPPLDYVDLDGGSGRDVFYRPDRYQRADLGLVRVSVEVVTQDQQRVCELFDVSQNGLAIEWSDDHPPQLGSEIVKLSVQFDDYEAYQGRATVSSVRRIGTTTIVGVSLLDTLMNIEDVLHLRDVKAWVAGAASDKLRAHEAPWQVSGQHRFKSLVADLRLFLEDGQVQLNELEASLPSHIAQGGQDSPARDALIERVKDGFSSDIIRASNEIDLATRSATGRDWDSLREFSRRHLHPLLMQAPWMHRALHKPLGYPGDFELMNGLYGNHFSGATLFAKAVNLAFVCTPAAEAVRTRKELMKQALSQANRSSLPRKAGPHFVHRRRPRAGGLRGLAGTQRNSWPGGDCPLRAGSQGPGLRARAPQPRREATLAGSRHTAPGISELACSKMAARRTSSTCAACSRSSCEAPRASLLDSTAC